MRLNFTKINRYGGQQKGSILLSEISGIQETATTLGGMYPERIPATEIHTKNGKSFKILANYEDVSNAWTQYLKKGQVEVPSSEPAEVVM